MTEYTPNGIMYTWEIAGPKGASFMLFPDEKHTKADVSAAGVWIRDNRDVVYMSLAQEEDRDDLYRAEIFRHPHCRGLKWYEINADNMKLIRKCRKVKMTVQQYVESHVIGQENQTHINNFNLRGSKIYDI